MSCLLHRNSKGSIVNVTTPSGKKSQLFEEIHSNIFMGSPEVSAKILSAAYTDEMQYVHFPEGSENTYLSGEPILFYKDFEGQIHNSVEELLLAGKGGGVTAGFMQGTGRFFPIVKFTTNGGKLSSFLSSQILEGTLSPKRVLGEDGVTRYQGKGEFLDTQVTMAVLFKANAYDLAAMGNVHVNKKDGTIEIVADQEMVIVENKEGSFGSIHINELSERADEFENSAELKAIYRVVTGQARPTTRQTKKAPIVSEKSIAQSLHSFLTSLGFSQTSLEEYRKRFNTIYGKDPDIQAMADISNRVVAYANGQITEDRLSEEVSHISLEAYSDQNSIVGALAVAHLTPEYAEHSEYYRTKYAPFFSGTELEDQVRKEVLGKILAKELLTRFQAEGRTEEGKTLVGSLKAMWDSFVAFIKERLKPFHVRTLNKLNKNIADSIINNNLSDFQYDLSSSNKFFYSAMSQSHQSLHQNLMRTKKVLEDSLRQESRTNPDKYFLERMQGDMTAINLLDSVNAVVGIVDRKVAELDRELRALTEDPNNLEVLSLAGYNVATALRGNLIPLITNMKSDVNKVIEENEISDPKLKEKLKSTADIITKSIETLIIKNSELQPLITKDEQKVAEKEFEAAYKKEDMTKEQYKKERQKFFGGVDSAVKDYGVFGKLFSLMTESRNPVLQLIAQKVQKMNLAVRMKFLSETNEPLDNILKKGLQKYEKAILEDGGGTHYVWGPFKFSKYDEDFQNKRVEILARLTEKKEEEILTKLKKYSASEILGNSDTKIEEYTKELKEWADTKRVRQMKDEYYEQKKEKFNKLGISVMTEETLKNFGARAADINKPYMTPGGQVDRSRMTTSDIEALNRIKKEREIVKSPFDRANELKTGLRLVKLEDMTQEEIDALPYTPSTDFKGELVVKDNNFSSENLPEESRIALDMNNIAYSYMFDAEQAGTTAAEEFKAKVNELEDKASKGEITYQEVFEWVTNNSTLSFTDEYYSSMDSMPSYEKDVMSYMEEIEDPDIYDKVNNLLMEYKSLGRTRKYLLRQNKKFGSSTDVNVHTMDERTRLKLLEIEDSLSGVRKSIGLPEEFMSSRVEVSSSELNEDFMKMAKEAGLAQEGDIYTFALKHMPHTRKMRAEAFAFEVTNLVNGNKVSMKRMFEDFFEELDAQGIINDQMTKEQVIRIAKDEYAKANVAGYFKKYVPYNMNETVEAMKSGELKLSDVIENKENFEEQYPGLKNIELKPDYTWTSNINSESMLNPAYKKGDYHLQLKEEYLDKKWFEFYGISVEEFMQSPTDDLSTLTATRNVEQFEFLKAYMQLREKAIENYGDKDRVNKWQRVQISKSGFEKLSSAGSLLNMAKLTKDGLKDFAQNRIDEKNFGEELDGVNLIQEGSEVSIRAIPKYFQKKLEDPAIVSQNTLSSVLLDLKESIVYAERVKAERDVRALMHQITNQNFIENGVSLKGRVNTKPGQVSNMYAKGREYIDHHLYGVQQARPFFVSLPNGNEVDLTKIVTNVQRFTRFSNLGFNLFVDLTGATTGFLNNVVDRYAGDYYHKSSVNLANSQAMAMMPKHLGELHKLDRTSKLGQILELMGIEDPSERVKESKAKRVGRFAKGSPYFFSRLSNMAIAPKIALATLNDYRYYKGEFVSFENFIHRKGAEGITEMKDVEMAWKAISQESLFNHLDFTGNGIGYTKSFTDKFDNPKQAFEDVILKVSSKAQKIIMNSDMVLNDADRVAAQRDVLTNTLLMHRGWMIINLTKRFKSDFYNVSTGRYEEGQYRTLLKLLTSTLNVVRGKESIGDVRSSLERYQQKNIARTGFETAILIALLMLGEAVLAGDDDDDTEMENLFQLIYLRTTSEFNSSTALGIPGSIVEAASSPIPSLNTYKVLNLFQTVPEAFQTAKDGENKLWKTIKKNSILRRYSQYSNLQAQIDAYRHFNDPTLMNLGEQKKQQDTGSNPLNSIRIN